MALHQSDPRPRRWSNAWWWLGFGLSVATLIFFPWPIGAALLLLTVAGWRLYRHRLSRS